MKLIKALIVEDSEDDALMLLRHLKQGGYEIEYQRVEDAAAMDAALAANDWQIVLSDYSMPTFDGLMALAILKQTGKDIPFIMISGTIGEDTAVQAMLAGVDDYFVKGNLNRLVPAIERELKEAENRAARRKAEENLRAKDVRLKLALQASGMGSWEWALDSNEIYWSPEVYELFGTDSFDSTFEKFLEFIHPDDVGAVTAEARRAIDGGGNFRHEFRVVKPDGNVIWVANQGLAEFDSDGKAKLLIGTVQDITERKARETAIQESEENLRAIIQASTQYVWTAAFDGSSPDLFRWFSKLSGRNIDDVAGMIDVIHPDDREEALESWKSAIDNRTAFSMIIRFLQRDGEYCFMATRAVPVFNANGTFRQWIGTCNDISKRLAAEDALRKNENQLQLVADTVPTKIVQLDADLNVLFLNKAAVEWFGGTREDFVHGNVRDVFTPDMMKAVENEFRRVLSGESFRVERASILPGQVGDYVQLDYLPEFNDKGEVSGFFIFIFDLTEIKQNEENLRKSEERFRSLVNSSSQLVWTADSEGNLLSALTPRGKALEIELDNLQANWVDRIHPDDRDAALHEYMTAIQQRLKYKAEYRMLHLDGTYHYYIARGTPVYENDGSIREWVGTLTDVTKAKNSEADLRRSEEQLRQAQKLESVGRLAGGIAHDFNNMLTAINGYSDLTLRRLSDNDPLRRNIEEIKKAGERSAALTQQLLAFSRRTILQMKILNLNQIVNDSIVMFQRLIGEDIQILSILNQDVNPLKADAGQLSQMLLNLVVNARDAMPNGGTITIETDTLLLNDEFVAKNPGARTGKFVMLSVHDTGVGIDEEMRQQIFEPFFTTKEMGKGTGLGLSTVYGIVNQLGGHIIVRSKVGKGTSFEIYLPIAGAIEDLPEIKALEPEESLGRETILLVEDEDLVRNLSRQVLETCGYKVIEARDGFEALDYCRRSEQAYDLLLTDVVMPLMSGRELAERVQVIYPSIKIMFTSGYTEDGVVRHGIKESEMNFIQKPFSFDELTRKVREVLDSPAPGDDVSDVSKKPE